MHRGKVRNGVEQALALGGAGARDVEVDDVGTQPLGCDLEGGAGAGGSCSNVGVHTNRAHLLCVVKFEAMGYSGRNQRRVC